MMSIIGAMVVAGEPVTGCGEPFTAIAAETGKPLEPVFYTASRAQIDEALARAEAVAPLFAVSAPDDRARLLETIAEAILTIGDALIDRAMAETGLPRARLEGERGRTVGQLRLFAAMLRDGAFVRARIDRAQPDRLPLPKPDLRLSMVALGPVAVFGASNFPLAFSVAGGDTASALAAGCPVIVKGHPAHPGTCELVARAVSEGVRQAGFDAGVFSMLLDGGIAVGQALARDTRIKAISFTGSRRAGEALAAIAANRAEPIPVYAEMSPTNPVVLLPGRLEEAAETIASQFVASLTLGTGQFCTNPGLVLAMAGHAFERFTAAAAAAVGGTAPGVMLTPGIGAAYASGVADLSARPGVTCTARGDTGDQRASAALFTTDADTFLADKALHAEVFGPASLVVRCRDMPEMERVLAAIEGQLTIAIHFNADDHDAVRNLLPIVQAKAGRILANGFGTGVEVSPAMVHGGPYPATTDGRTTSVGTLAVERFLRPVCLQDFPESLLPDALKDANPWNLPRTVG